MIGAETNDVMLKNIILNLDIAGPTKARPRRPSAAKRRGCPRSSSSSDTSSSLSSASYTTRRTAPRPGNEATAAHKSRTTLQGPLPSGTFGHLRALGARQRPLSRRRRGFRRRRHVGRQRSRRSIVSTESCVVILRGGHASPRLRSSSAMRFSCSGRSHAGRDPAPSEHQRFQHKS